MPERYVVQPGDNLSKIARRFGMTWRELYDFGGDTGTPNSARLRSGNPNLIFPGEVLLLPDAEESGDGQVDTVESSISGGLAARLYDFGTNRDELKPAHKEWLATNAVPTIVGGGRVVSVVGFASPLGSASDNLALSQRRAEGVLQFLRSELDAQSADAIGDLPAPVGEGDVPAEAAGLALRSNEGFFRAVEIDLAPSGQGGGPVGQGDYVVTQGDCILSIAEDHGHFWETIWNDPANEELQAVRKTPTILLPGDRVTIPPLRKKEKARETENRHRFRLRGQPAFLRLTLLANDQPRRGEPYKLTIDGQEFSDVLDPEGKLLVPIAPNARGGTLLVGEGDQRDEFDITLGHLDPSSEVSGVQQRLSNLGFPCLVTRVPDEQTSAAVTKFQSQSSLATTGDSDTSTKGKLEQSHDFD